MEGVFYATKKQGSSEGGGFLLCHKETRKAVLRNKAVLKVEGVFYATKTRCTEGRGYLTWYTQSGPNKVASTSNTQEEKGNWEFLKCISFLCLLHACCLGSVVFLGSCYSAPYKPGLSAELQIVSVVLCG